MSCAGYGNSMVLVRLSSEQAGLTALEARSRARKARLSGS